MAEERADECLVALHLGELHGDAIGQLFALLQRLACVAGALGMAPDQLIGVEIRGVAGQVMRGQELRCGAQRQTDRALPARLRPGPQPR